MGKRGNGEGSISRRPDGRWQGCVSHGRNDNGKLRRQYFYGKTRKEVADKINEAIKKLQQNSFIDRKDNPTVGKWLFDWLWSYKRSSVKPKTFDQYETLARIHLQPKIGEIKLIDLTTDHVQRLINDMHKSGLSKRTIELTKVVLHAALKQAQRNKLVSENVCDNVVLPRKETTSIKVLEIDEQSKLIEVLEENYIGRGLLLALYTGMRRGEVLALKWTDYDEEKQSISVNKSLSRVRTYDKSRKKTELVVGTPKTEKSKRTIPLIDKAVELLEKHRQCQKQYKELVGNFYEDNGLIFSSSNGGYMDPGNFNRKLNKVTKELGMETFSPHVLRHSFATRGLEAEVSLKAMQELLGHSSITVTGNIYTHLLEEQKRKEVEKLNKIF